MSGKWNNNETTSSGGNDALGDKFGGLFKDEFAVILLQGKNSFGDMIYSYVKVGLPNIKLLYAAMNSGEDFSPSDFGEIIAAGKGMPTEEIRAEMANSYSMLQPITPTSFNPANATQSIDLAKKKSWDEF